MNITFPHLGNTYIAIEPLLKGAGHHPVTPPPGSKRTLEWGSELSPEHACLPFKIILGNMLEGIQAGADSVLMIGGCGPCRLGYYGEIHRILLARAGRQVEFLTLEPPDINLADSWRLLRKLLGGAKIKKFKHGCRMAWAKLAAIERLESQALQVRPREKTKGSTSSFVKGQLQKLYKSDSVRSLQQVCGESEEGFRDLIKSSKSGTNLKIALVGEIYTVVEPLANLNIEERLGRLGVEVVRTISLKRWVEDHVFKKIFGNPHLKLLKKSAQGYLRGFIGGHGLETVARSADFCRAGFGGIIHILPLACMPEVVAQGILPKISSDFKVPIMSLVVDEHSGEAGFQTRLEAFVDLVERRSYKRV